MFSGSIVALVTPFTQAKEIDYLALERLIEWHIEEGTAAIVLCGTTGEDPTLDHDEKLGRGGWVGNFVDLRDLTKLVRNHQLSGVKGFLGRNRLGLGRRRHSRAKRTHHNTQDDAAPDPCRLPHGPHASHSAFLED